MPPGVALALVGMAAAGGLLVGCGSSGGSSAEDGAGSGPIEVTDVWIRPTPPVGNLGAFYFIITNTGSDVDRLVGVDSPRCEMVELHQTEVEDGTASMGPAGPDDLVVAPDAQVRFEPLGLHAMCLGLTDPVVEGELVPLTLSFETAGPIRAEAVAADR
ncbi:MAG: copper chaperone PCu(A)C [Acidimicrobiales bacterium]